MRRGFRRQRRHIRATRLRIARLQQLLRHLGVLTQDQLDANEGAWPWLLAARVLRGGKTLTWNELWEVLRWYAHNRGYDGNKGWSRQDAARMPRIQRRSSARANYLTAFKRSMDERARWRKFSAIALGVDPLGAKKSSMKRVRNLGAAFPREGIEAEVERILRAHLGVLPRLDERFIEAVMRDYTKFPGAGLPAAFALRPAACQWFA